MLNSALVPTITAFEASAETRRSWMLNAIKSHCWDNVPQLSENPQKALRDLAIKQLAVADTFKKAMDENKKKEFQAEHDELVARLNLKGSLDAILALVENMKSKAALEICNSDLNTRPITEMSKNMAATVITPTLKNAIDGEFQTLGIGHIKSKLDRRHEKGKTYYSLLLDLPTTARIENILSEGEQRAIAIGSFLAELQLAGHKGAIIFDDPVSSLDHHRRKRVAERMVKEAAKRQVIVFTHDTVFLGELLDQVKQQGVASCIHHLEWESGMPGHINEGLPWEHQGYEQRLHTLKQNQKRIAKDWQVYPNAEQRKKMWQQYDDIRATIERAIQDIVFNDVINRYRDYIQVGKLDKVAVLTDNECKEINRLYQRCNELTPAHDPSSA